MTNPSPHSEQARLQAIVDLDLLSPEVSALLEDITQRAARELNVTVATFSLVLGQAQHFVASQGIDGWIAASHGTPVEWSFCQNAVDSREPFIVQDATQHPKVETNPLVTQDGLRCYCGVPLITSQGHALGTLCVLGNTPRQFSNDEVNTLKALAREAIQRIETRAQHPSPG